MDYGHKELSKFRNWLRHVWNAHVEEIENWEHHAPDYSLSDYVKRYKWWLRREYRHHQQKGKV